MIKIRYLIFYTFLLLVVVVKGQVTDGLFTPPFDFDLYLSGNFGELRSNHFHAGLDFKTQGVEGKPIYAVVDGSIVRAKVQAGGYGRALYVLHGDSLMTVYGHLQKFPAKIDEAVRKRQYADECFAVDIGFAVDEFPVKRGELLAYAGNSGYSFGPHLHFEMRSADGEELYNPMRYYAGRLTDTRAPQAQAVAFYPIEGQGAVCGGGSSLVRRVQNGSLADTLTVWGRVAFGLKGVDYMNGTHNKYGIYEMELYVDDSLRFAARVDNFSFAENRLINAWADYERLSAGKGWFVRSHILPNNPLRFIKADAADGVVDFCEERLYRVEYRLRDYHGNSSVCSFVVVGKRCDVVAAKRFGGNMLRWALNNKIYSPGIMLDVPRAALFDDYYMLLSVDDSLPSPVYRLAAKPVPLWRAARLTLDIPQSLVPFASKCYVARVNGGKRSSVGGVVHNGVITANIYQLDSYAVAVDTLAPKVNAVREKQWARNGRVLFAVKDTQTGISSFKGTVDGQFVLFEYSSKNGLVTCDFKRERVARGVHELRLVVVDNVGNETIIVKNIKY